MQQMLTRLQGYNCMFKLLDAYYEQTNSDDIGGLASIMCFFADGVTADPAIWKDWLRAIDSKEQITKQEAFEGMIGFLEDYGVRVSSEDALSIVKSLRSAKNCNDLSVELVKQWNSFLHEVLAEPEGSREYLQL